MRAVAYFRYSTANTAQVDNSEARQRDTVEKLIYANGWELLQTFTDHATSGADDKPELIRLQNLLSDGKICFDVIVVDSLSRLSRRGLTKIGLDLNWIEESGILFSVADHNNGKPFTLSEFDDDLTLGFKSWMNHKYVKDISRQSTNGMRTKFAKREIGWMGVAPFGYNLIKFAEKNKPSILRPNEDLPIVKEIFEAFLSGKSIYSCTELLAKSPKYSLAGAKQPARGSVINILRNAIYAGIRTIGVRGVGKYNTVGLHKHSYVKQNPLTQCADYHPYDVEGFSAAISLAQFNEVQNKLDSNQKAFRKFPSRHAHEYSGLLRCWHCKAVLTAAPYKHDGKKLIRYVCPNSTHGYNKKCDDDQKPKRKQVRDDEISFLIADRFSGLLTNEDFHKNNLSLIVDRLISQSKPAKEFIETNANIQQKRLDELVELFQETGSEALKVSINQQIKKINEIKEAQKKSLEQDRLLKVCQEEMNQLGVGSGKFLYFGHIYEYAVDIATYSDPSERNQHIAMCASAIADYTADYVKMIDSTYESAHHFNNLSKIMALHGDDYMPLNQQISILKRMGLDHIQVMFEMQKWRGRDRRVPVALDFVFSVALSDCTRTHVVYRRNQIELL